MKRISILFAAIFAVLGLVSAAAAQNSFAVGTTLENFTLSDIKGGEQSFDKLKGKNGALLIFLSAQCPIVKMYDERINEIANEYKAKGINVIGINSNVTESLEWVKSHAEENYKFPMLIDKGNIIADKLGATVTPEVYYFNAKNVLVYHGAIDNDRSAKNITDRYLRDATEAALSGKAVARAKTNAFGCTIKRVGEK